MALWNVALLVGGLWFGYAVGVKQKNWLHNTENNLYFELEEEYTALSEKNKKLKEEINDLTTENIGLNRDLSFYRSAYKSLARERGYKADLDTGERELMQRALRFAIRATHPDKCGDQYRKVCDEFIKLSKRLRG